MSDRPAPPDARQRLGLDGEAAAAAELERAGLRVVERRWRAAGAELDLIAVDEELVVFVEVKARAGVGYGAPADLPNHSGYVEVQSCGAWCLAFLTRARRLGLRVPAQATV